MKTLILNGSPRKRGDTAHLIQAVKEHLQGEVREIRAFEAGIRSCTDCRYCRAHADCAIRDGGKELLAAIRESDCILIASPVWFGTLPGELLSMLSRLQAEFSGHAFRGEPMPTRNKKGAILLTAGGSGGEENAIQTATILLKEMGAGEIFPAVCVKETDHRPASENVDVLEKAKQIAAFFNCQEGEVPIIE